MSSSEVVKLPLDLVSPNVDLHETLEILDQVEQKLLDILSVAESAVEMLASPTSMVDTDYSALQGLTQDYCRLTREVHQELSTQLPKLAMDPELVSSERWDAIERSRKEEEQQELVDKMNDLIDELYGIETEDASS